MKKSTTRWMVLVAMNVAAWYMLGFQGSTVAEPADAKQPFNNAVEQRQQMIRELQDIKALLKEQTAAIRQLAAQDDPNERRK
jgi:hypothetical protein